MHRPDAGLVRKCDLTQEQCHHYLQAADKARSYFKDAPNVTVVDDVPIDDGWTRDWGPSVRAAVLEFSMSSC